LRRIAKRSACDLFNRPRVGPALAGEIMKLFP
jgi:hypothetical protein